MNINRHEKLICNLAWPVLLVLLIWLWVDSAEARWMPDGTVVAVVEIDCE